MNIIKKFVKDIFTNRSAQGVIGDLFYFSIEDEGSFVKKLHRFVAHVRFDLNEGNLFYGDQAQERALSSWDPEIRQIGESSVKNHIPYFYTCIGTAPIIENSYIKDNASVRAMNAFLKELEVHGVTLDHPWGLTHHLGDCHQGQGTTYNEPLYLLLSEPDFQKISLLSRKLNISTPPTGMER